jgi:hypothetical protein
MLIQHKSKLSKGLVMFQIEHRPNLEVLVGSGFGPLWSIELTELELTTNPYIVRVEAVNEWAVTVRRSDASEEVIFLDDVLNNTQHLCNWYSSADTAANEFKRYCHAEHNTAENLILQDKLARLRMVFVEELTTH